MTEKGKKRPFYWEQFSPAPAAQDGSEHKESKLPPGADLASMRRGIGRDPGSMPAMWPLYTQLKNDGRLTRELWAEHNALSLFGVHQQGESFLVHRPGFFFGAAVRQLRDDGRHSDTAVDRRFAAAATANDVTEVAHHLRGLVNLLKTLTPTQGFDYTELFNDLCAWQNPKRRGDVRRRWGAAYYTNQLFTTSPTDTTGNTLS